jgi:hypothetical protein
MLSGKTCSRASSDVWLIDHSRCLMVHHKNPEY